MTDELTAVLATLTVGLIMVPRKSWTICTPDDLCSDIAKSNLGTQYSTIPVVVEDRVLGLCDATRWFKGTAPSYPVGDDYAPLSEDILIAEDASIFDFVQQADRFPTNLVVKGTRIEGLVSLSDLQQLPVRAALFTLVTSFEMVMAQLIETKLQDLADWKRLLSLDRMQKLDKRIAEAKASDAYTGDLVLTQFSDKRDILIKAKLLSGGRNKLEDRFRRIEDLRNNLAHSNHYASSDERAKAVCGVVRDIYEMKNQMVVALGGRSRSLEGP